MGLGAGSDGRRFTSSRIRRSASRTWRTIDNRTDENSYEMRNADRPAQYYGDVRWTTAWPVLKGKFGR